MHLPVHFIFMLLLQLLIILLYLILEWDNIQYHLCSYFLFL